MVPAPPLRLRDGAGCWRMACATVTREALLQAAEGNRKRLETLYLDGRCGVMEAHVRHLTKYAHDICQLLGNKSLFEREVPQDWVQEKFG